ncbi:MAG: HAMP domain-containing histidine kinase [Candidatus Dormibacteraeota bacterium]|nr:HAMP domain-containing histidine kinase [Candidatus Dormibacteraeota bacterium]
MNSLPFAERLDLDRYLALRHRIPIRGRIALFGAAVVAVTVILFGALVYVTVARSLVAQQDDSLQQQNSYVWKLIESGRPLRLGAVFPASDLNASSAPFVEIVQTNGQTGSTGTINDSVPVLPDSTWQNVPIDHGVARTVRAANGPLLRVYVRAWSSPGANASGYVLVGQPLFGIENLLGGLRLFLIALAFLSLLGAAAVSWLVAGRALRPLVAMASTAEDIGMTQDLSRRLPESAADDEVGRLERSFNQMLRQLEDAYHRLQSALVAQRRFVADASHELRSPLTTIRGNVGLLLKRSDITVDDRLAALNDIAGESERMSRMVQDLLTLARADAGYHLEKSAVDLEPIIQDVSRQAQTLQPSRRVELQDGMPIMVQGNADALKQLLWILVDNAMKHTPDGGRIRMRLGTAGLTAELAVADDGPGIPREDLERVFERFYQADSARSGEGTGLGLAIARWIAEEHGGRVFAGNNPEGGAIFTVQLPATKVLVNS